MFLDVSKKLSQDNLFKLSAYLYQFVCELGRFFANLTIFLLVNIYFQLQMSIF